MQVGTFLLQIKRRIQKQITRGGGGVGYIDNPMSCRPVANCTYIFLEAHFKT